MAEDKNKRAEEGKKAQHDEQKMQENYLRFQMLQQQLEQISQHLEMLSQQNAELTNSIQALQELEHTEKGQEVLAPIANGVFLKTELKDKQKLIVNMGSDVAVEKSLPEVIKLLEEQKTELTVRTAEAETVLEQLQGQAMKIYQELQEHETCGKECNHNH